MINFINNKIKIWLMYEYFRSDHNSVALTPSVIFSDKSAVWLRMISKLVKALCEKFPTSPLIFLTPQSCTSPKTDFEIYKFSMIER